MARNIDSALRVELTGSSVAPILLAKFSFSTVLNLWSGFGDIIFAGDTYIGVGHFGKISVIGETQLLRAAGVAFSISGIPSTNISLALTEDYSERVVKLWLGVISASRSLVGTPILLFAGRMDVMEINEQGETSNIKIKAENRLIDLERPKERRYTDKDQKNFFPNDEGLSFVSALNDGRKIVWGRN